MPADTNLSKTNRMRLLIPALALLLAGSCAGFRGNFSSPAMVVGLVAADYDRTLDFYTDILGMRQTGSERVSEEESRRLGLANGFSYRVTTLVLDRDRNATELKILGFERSARAQPSNFVQDYPGLRYLTFYVEELDPFLDRLRRNDVRFLGRTPTEREDGRPYLLIQDPNGVFIELVEAG